MTLDSAAVLQTQQLVMAAVTEQLQLHLQQQVFHAYVNMSKLYLSLNTRC